MSTYSAIERMEERTPHFPEGFSFLNQPEASIVYSIPEGRLHFFHSSDFQRNLRTIQECAVGIDQPSFEIDYWQAMREVAYNTKSEAASSALFEPGESLKAKLPNIPQDKGRERVFSSTLTRLAAPITNLFSSQEEPKGSWYQPFAAYTTQEIWRPNSSLGIITVMYVSTIAVVPGITANGIGPSLFQHIYNALRPDIVAMRVQNGAPVSALEKADRTEGPVYGVDEEWDADPLMRSLEKFFGERTLHPNGIDTERLIAIGIYPEGESKTYRHGYTEGRAFEVTNKLRDRGLDFARGDGAYIAVWGKGKKELWKKRGNRRSFVVSYPIASEPLVA